MTPIIQQSDDSVNEKITNLIDTLKNTVNNIQNDWNSKERENYIYNQVTSLNFVEDGKFILKNKSLVGILKKEVDVTKWIIKEVSIKLRRNT